MSDAVPVMTADEATATLSAEIRARLGDDAFEFPLDLVATHEAAHAVIGVVEQFRPERIWLITDGKIWGGCVDFVEALFCDDTTDSHDDLRAARVSLAGSIAEHAIIGAQRPGGSVNDIIEAGWAIKCAASKLGLDFETLWDQTLAETHALIMAHRPAIERLADALVGSPIRALNAAQISALLLTEPAYAS